MSLSPLELNAEIERIEAGIVLREARLRGRVADLGQRVDAAMPKVLAAGVVAAALGGLLLWLRPRRSIVAAQAAEAPSGAESHGWLYWVNMAWPLLPLSLRTMIDLRLVMAIGGPLLAMFKRRKAPANSASSQRPPPPPASPDDARQKHG
jgi:hypothetical protein